MEASLNGPLGRSGLGQSAVKIGRAPDNTLVINDPQSSAHHAEITPGFAGNGHQITDLNSTNGTFVNEQRLTANQPYQLNAGEVIRIGDIRFTYESASGYAPTIMANALTGDQTIPMSIEPPVYQQPPDSSSYNAPPPPPPGSQPTLPMREYPQAGNLPQPGYPLASGFDQSAYPASAQKKNRLGLLIGLIALLLLVVGASIGGYLYVNRSTPEKTLQAYCDGWKTSNAQEIYNQLDTNAQSKLPVSTIQRAIRGFNSFIFDGVKDCTYSNVLANGSTATAIVTFTFGNGRSIAETDTLIQENSNWRIDSGKLGN